MELRAIVGRNIRREREKQGIPQDELAHRADIHVTYLSGIENGRRNITLGVLEKLATALRVTEGTLVQR